MKFRFGAYVPLINHCTRHLLLAVRRGRTLNTSNNSNNSNVVGGHCYFPGISVKYCQYSVSIILPPILGMITGRTDLQIQRNSHAELWMRSGIKYSTNFTERSNRQKRGGNYLKLNYINPSK